MGVHDCWFLIFDIVIVLVGLIGKSNMKNTIFMLHSSARLEHPSDTRRVESSNLSEATSYI